MDNKNKILNVVGYSDYRKGLNYYENITFEYVSREKYSKIFSYTVDSESNYYKKYNVRIIIENNDVKKTYCNCKQYNAFGSCKHVAAVLIEYQEQLFDESTLLFENLGNSILDLFIEKEEKNVVKKQARIELVINIIHNYYYNRIYYELKIKIGCNKMYIANKKISDFIDIYLGIGREKELKFGKDFIYNKNEYYFDEKDKKVIEFLKRNRNRNFDSYMDDEEISKIISTLEGKEITITGYGTFNKIEQGNPFNVLLNKKNDNYNLKITNIEDILLLGLYPTYALYKNKLYEVDIKMLNFLSAMAKRDIIEFEFSKNELNKFTNGLLKIIKDNIEVDNSLKDEIVICKTPQPRLYFDYYYNAVCCNPKFLYNNIEADYFIEDSNILRDKTFENEVITELLSYNFELDNDRFIMNDINYIGKFIEEDLINLTDKYEVFTSDKIKKTKIVKSNVRSSFGIGEDNILSYNFNLGNIDNKEISSILNDLKNKKKYYRLKSGDIINLEEDQNLNELNKLMNDMDIDNNDVENGNGQIPKYRAIYLDSLKNNKYSIIDTDNLFNTFIDNFNKYKDVDINFTKKDLEILRDYQVTGIKWLYNIYKCGLGCILADEMGLGKSIQFIYFIKQVLKEKKDSKILIVAPTSLIFNWEKEFDKFGSELNYKVIYGLKEKRLEKLSNLENTNIIITTYGMVREDLDIYKDISFEVMAIDEAQNIKNISTMVSKAVKKINANVKIAITGTPLENNVLELWSIFDYIMPGYLTNVKNFQSKYNIKEVDDDNLNKLEDLNVQIKPFILRRKKIDVLNDLPPKIENNIYIELNDKQKKIYMAEVEKTKKEMDEAILEEGFTKARFKILQLLTRLRQICIDPKIVYENYSYESSKINETVSLVKNVIANNHKILIFTSFKTALNILNKKLNNEGISTYVIDGSVSSKKRMELVDKFNNDDTNAFLITIKSGGTGLNLTSADVVIHLDLWWNPQVENQATDRSHRIGQKNTVEVIKLVCKGTIEEKILELQNKKKILSDKLIEGDNRDQNIISSLTEEDIKSLFSYDLEEEYNIVK